MLAEWWWGQGEGRRSRAGGGIGGDGRCARGGGGVVMVAILVPGGCGDYGGRGDRDTCGGDMR